MNTFEPILTALKTYLGSFAFLVTASFWIHLYFTVKYTSILLILALLGFAVYVVYKSTPLRRTFYVSDALSAKGSTQSSINLEEFQKRDLRKRWDNLVGRASKGGYGHAIIEADALLEGVLGRMGYQGTTMAERLKSLGNDVGNIDELWDAHKMRNKIAHEPGTRISREDTMKILATYRQALIDLKAI